MLTNCWVWLCIIALAISIAHAEETPKDALAVTVYKDVYSDYERFVRGRPIADINYYGGPSRPHSRYNQPLFSGR